MHEMAWSHEIAMTVADDFCRRKPRRQTSAAEIGIGFGRERKSFTRIVEYSTFLGIQY